MPHRAGRHAYSAVVETVAAQSALGRRARDLTLRITPGAAEKSVGAGKDPACHVPAVDWVHAVIERMAVIPQIGNREKLAAVTVLVFGIRARRIQETAVAMQGVGAPAVIPQPPVAQARVLENTVEEHLLLVRAQRHFEQRVRLHTRGGDFDFAEFLACKMGPGFDQRQGVKFQNQVADCGR